ncbi:MAG: hypothetical protein J0H64_10705, partial [Actinobacteria bacterium]|nr:hypothetical protein [Actinomycetota bacterium]
MEIVISMMLFAFLAVAILPLIIGVTNITVKNSGSLSAKAVMQQKIAAIQRYYPTNTTIQVDSRPVGQTRNCADLPIV